MRLLFSLLLLLLLTAPAAAGTGKSGSYRIIYLRQPVTLYDRPNGQPLAAVAPISQFGSPQTLTVVAARSGWLAVISTQLANNRPGWLPEREVRGEERRTRLWLSVSLARHRLTLRRGGQTLRSFTVGVGSPATSTPTGSFAITDKLPGSAYSPVYGCCILALSGHQTHLAPGWRGGDRLALHGTDAPWTIGRNASNGCLHLRDEDLRYLLHLLPLGTKVVIGR